MADDFGKVRLTCDEVMVLYRCRKDGAPPHDLDEDEDDGANHRRLQAMGLLDHRVGPAPDGSGPADFWSTNEAGEWALRLGWREWFGGEPPAWQQAAPAPGSRGDGDT